MNPTTEKAPQSASKMEALDLAMSDRQIGTPVGACPLTECAVTVYVTDDTKKAIAGVKAQVDTVLGVNTTDKNGFTNFKGIKPPNQDYTVRVDLDAKATDFFWDGSVQPTNQDTKNIPGGTDKFYLFQANRKGSLNVKVVHVEPDTSEVAEPTVQVKATGAATGKIIGPQAWGATASKVFPDSFELETVFDLPQAKKFRIPAKPTVVVGVGEDKVGNIKLELNVRTLIVDVVRRDIKTTLENKALKQENKPLSQAAVVKIKGPSPATTVTTVNTAWNDTDKVDRAVFKMPDEGDYEVTVEPKKDEADFKTTPDSAKITATVPRDGEKKVEFILTPFKEIQFIGFDIDVLPGQKKKKGAPKGTMEAVYLGSDDAKKDITKRCTIMTAAVKAAFGHASVDPSSKVLKIFMAPEFYFRNTSGAYPIENVSEIMVQMRKETSNAKYKDWLFVFGTAIGYLKHEELDKKKRGTGVGLRHEANIISVTPGVGSTVVRVDSKVCGQIQLDVPWKLSQDPVEGEITACVPVLGDEYDLTFASVLAFAVGDAELAEPISTEAFNLALVQRGGPDNRAPGDKSPREAIVYKEYVSNMDFIRDTTKNWQVGSEHKITIHKTTDRLVVPTQGSTDMLGGVGTKNLSELNENTLGGGSVLTIDGITFGLEICLDHAMNKLAKFYQTNPSGAPKVQVHLIPSCGIDIGEGTICSPPTTGAVFNVDGNGPGKHVIARMNDGQYSCDKHPTIVQGGPGACPNCDRYYPCENGHGWGGPGVCPTCQTQLTLRAYTQNAPGNYFRCPNGHSFMSGRVCAVCAEALTAFTGAPGAHLYLYDCVNGHMWSGPGDCPTCGGEMWYRSPQLLPIGTPIASVGAKPEVELKGLDWISTSHKKYFNAKGNIIVFPKKPLPDPADVP